VNPVLNPATAATADPARPRHRLGADPPRQPLSRIAHRIRELAGYSLLIQRLSWRLRAGARLGWRMAVSALRRYRDR
jgi:hypothetical protein